LSGNLPLKIGKIPMQPEEIIQNTAEYVKREFQNDSSGHDWWHIHRVWKNALSICQHEPADVFIVELAALLHDLDDWKLNPSADGSPVRAAAWLRQMEVDAAVSAHICEIISHLSYKGAGVENKISTIEGMIVQDADRLDAIGAVGIGRAFAYGGHAGRSLYDPDEPPQMHQSFEQYKNSRSATINHFYEKLFLLKERMNTSTAKRIAGERHAYMEEFVTRFLREWDGKDFDGETS
jgi:uncharacterized protein